MINSKKRRKIADEPSISGSINEGSILEDQDTMVTSSGFNLASISLASSPQEHRLVSPTSPQIQPPLFRRTSSGNTHASLNLKNADIKKGDMINLDGYRDCSVLSIHYDETVVCRGISLERGGMKVWIKLSLSAS